MVFGWIKSGFSALQKALSSTRKRIGERISKLLGRSIDESLLEELEEILYEADLGVSITQDLVGKIRLYMKSHREATGQEILSVIEQGLCDELSHLNHSLTFSSQDGPTVYLIVGTNGNGKTTSCAKLALFMQKQLGKKVLFGACDTFRAAAQEQLTVWAERLQIDIVKGRENGDPAAVAFDACQAAKARGCDVVILDTAGRLENKQNLMKELEKIKKSCSKALGETGAPHETLLVLDATVGHNGIEQAKSFNSVVPLTGLILTKLDGSAKGGSVIAIQKQMKLPVKCIGIGEKAEDMMLFEPKEFVRAMLFEETESE